MGFKEYLKENNIENLIKQIENEGAQIGIFIDSKRKILSLLKLIIPKEFRGSGTGAKIMNMITKHADDKNLTIVLTPTTDFGAPSISRLIKFYKKFGFVENKGKNRDFEISDDMYRLPN